ncbi:MAG TPA: DUF6438 domain-containing protein [Saprospiraceae bacterium]|nr:DUF6438 domain-containing protein [Saprospiraceae bacterium]
MYRFYWWTFCIVVAFIACQSTKPLSQKQNEKLDFYKVLSLQKSPCFGNCAVYKITVFSNGLAVYEGKENVEMKGVYFTEIKNSQSLIQQIRSVQWDQFNSNYFLNIPDLPELDMKYYDTEGVLRKTIHSNTNLPSELSKINDAVIKLEQSEHWTQLLKKEQANTPEIIKDEIIVDIDSSITSQQLLQDFQFCGLKIESQLSQYMSLYLMSFNKALIGPYELLIVLRKQKGIRSANYNKKLSSREE